MDLYKIPYSIVKLIGKPIFLIRFRPNIINKSNIPKKGAVIFCGNHRNHLDPFCAICSTKRIIHYTAKKELMNGGDALIEKPNLLALKLNSLLLKSVGTISVDRDGDTSKATDIVAQYLIKGSAIGIFPEGTRNKTDEVLLPFKFGAVSLAKKTDAFIMPFAITGKYQKNGNLTVRFGEPFKVGEMSLDEANNELRQKILALICESRQEAAG